MHKQARTQTKTQAVANLLSTRTKRTSTAEPILTKPPLMLRAMQAQISAVLTAAPFSPPFSRPCGRADTSRAPEKEESFSWCIVQRSSAGSLRSSARRRSTRCAALVHGPAIVLSKPRALACLLSSAGDRGVAPGTRHRPHSISSAQGRSVLVSSSNISRILLRLSVSSSHSQ